MVFLSDFVNIIRNNNGIPVAPDITGNDICIVNVVSYYGQAFDIESFIENSKSIFNL